MKQESNSKARRITLVAAAVLVGAVALFLVLRDRDHDGTVRFGVLMPLTGDWAAYGVAMRDAADLATSELNQEGGLLGRQVILAVEDTRSAPREALSAFEKLTVQAGVRLVIGPMASAEVLSIAPRAEQRKVLVFTPSASSPEITTAGDFIFRNVPSDVFEGRAMASVAAVDLGLQSVSILQTNSDYGHGVVGEFKQEFERLGGSVPIVELYPEGTRDFRTSLLRIGGVESEGLFFVGYKEMGVGVAQASELGLDMQYLSTAVFEDPDIIAAAGDAAEGLVFTSITFDPANPSRRAQRFVESYKAKTGRPADGYAASAYDATHILAQAVRVAESNEAAAVRDALYQLEPFEGLIGTIEFDSNGDAMLPIRLKRVRGGRFEAYDPQ